MKRHTTDGGSDNRGERTDRRGERRKKKKEKKIMSSDGGDNDNKALAEAEKAKGNAALQSNNPTLAIEHYTKAINYDGTNHVYYSNRSAAYLKKDDATNALQDAESCLGLKPHGFAKGYSRKGAALHALKRYNDSVAVYEEGLMKFPNDKGLTSGLASVKRDKDAPPGGYRTSSSSPFGAGGAGAGAAANNPMASLFGGTSDLMAKIALDPSLRQHLNDPEFVEKVKTLQTNPSSLETMLGDPRMMQVFRLVLREQGMDMKMPEDMEAEMGGQEEEDSVPAPADKKKKQEEEEDTKMEEEEEEELTPEEMKILENKKKSIQAKERGNELYKKRDFDNALASYDEAIQLDPTNMTFLSNKAAVYFTQKLWDECITACEQAVEIGKMNRAPFEDRCKALTRCAKAYHKKKDLTNAIETIKAALLESYDKPSERLLKNWELEKRQSDKLAYQDDNLAEEAKQRGNSHFRSQEYGDAVREYEEAVKRSPKNAPIRNNLSAALCKIMDFNGAKREIEKALELDPKYVKAWARKGDIEIIMKENHKAMDSYKAGLALDPTNKTCTDGLRKVATMINAGSSSMTEEERKERAEHALADPEIQSILSDPIMRQVLQDFQENPKAANDAMSDPLVRAKIEKLIASGVVQTG